MIYGIGIDLTEKSRIRSLYQRFKDNFSKRILTIEELEVFNDFDSIEKKIEFLSGRFSVKESYAKAMGTGLGSIGFQDIAVLNQVNGKPFFLYHPFKGHGLVSISHTKDLVITEVILEKEKNEI